jgi:energy-coupling factor transporter transmembrane protein EcfT
MNASTKPIGQVVEKRSFLNRLSLRNKLIGVALLVFVVLLATAIN